MTNFATVDIQPGVCHSAGGPATDGRGVAILSQAAALAEQGHHVDLLVSDDRPIADRWAAKIGVRTTQAGEIPCHTESGTLYDAIIANDPASVNAGSDVLVLYQPHEFEVLRHPRTGEHRAADLELQEEAIRRADGILVPSRAIKEFMVRFYELPADRVLHAPHGVDQQLFRPLDRQSSRKNVGVKPGRKQIVFVGRIEPRKGLHILCEAFEELRCKADLIIIGGPETEEDQCVMDTLEQWSESHVERVRMTGRLDWQTLPLYYSSADVVVLPSLMEPFGLPTLEALACGAPVVGTEIDGFRDIVRHDSDGILVPAGDASALAHALDSVLEDSDWQSDEQTIGRAQRAGALGWDRAVGVIQAFVESQVVKAG